MLYWWAVFVVCCVTSGSAFVLLVVCHVYRRYWRVNSGSYVLRAHTPLRLRLSQESSSQPIEPPARPRALPTGKSLCTGACSGCTTANGCACSRCSQAAVAATHSKEDSKTSQQQQQHHNSRTCEIAITTTDPHGSERVGGALPAVVSAEDRRTLPTPPSHYTQASGGSSHVRWKVVQQHRAAAGHCSGSPQRQAPLPSPLLRSRPTESGSEFYAWTCAPGHCSSHFRTHE